MQRQMDLCEFKATLSQVVVTHTFSPSTWESHTFNPNTREVKTGKDMAGWREEYKAGGTGAHGILSEDSWRQDLVPSSLRIQQR